jgi:DNA-binding transcriptional ArsR family regulator
MDAMLRALSDGTRRQILTLVWREERSAGDIAAEFSMTRPSISQHLAVLLDSDLVSVRRAGTRRLYRANRQAVAQLRAELAVMWVDSLARLKTSLEASGRKRRKR